MKEIESAVRPAGLAGKGNEPYIEKVVRTHDKTWYFDVTFRRVFSSTVRHLERNGWQIRGVKLRDGRIVAEIFRK